MVNKIGVENLKIWVIPYKVGDLVPIFGDILVEFHCRWRTWCMNLAMDGLEKLVWVPLNRQFGSSSLALHSLI